MAKKYAVQFDECENRSKIVAWRQGVPMYIRMDGREEGAAKPVTFTQAKREVMEERLKDLELAKREVARLRSMTKTRFDEHTARHDAAMAEYQARIDAQQDEDDRKTREYEANRAEFEKGLALDITAEEKRLAVFLWRHGYWAAGWQPFGGHAVTFDHGGIHAMVSRNSDGQWSAAVTVGDHRESTMTSLTSGGIPAGIAWVDATTDELAKR